MWNIKQPSEHCFSYLWENKPVQDTQETPHQAMPANKMSSDPEHFPHAFGLSVCLWLLDRNYFWEAVHIGYIGEYSQICELIIKNVSEQGDQED